jgi:ankyrin repeat protein
MNNTHLALLNCIGTGNIAGFKQLLKLRRVDANRRGNHDNTILMEAIIAAADDMVRSVLTYDIDYDAVNADGYTALVLAVVNGNYHIIWLLLEMGHFDIEFVNPYPPDRGYTALHYASIRHDPAICQLLIQYGANINRRSASGDTPLSLAVGFNRLSVVRWLLSKGADIRWTDPSGDKTLLMLAIFIEDYNLLDLLIEKRAPFSKNRDIMQHIEDSKIVNLLAEYDRRTITFTSFLMGTLPRLGRASPLYTSMVANVLYEPQLFRHIYEFHFCALTG